MTLQIKTDPAPLRLDPDGAARVGNTRVTLDAMLAEYKLGSSAEEIAEQFDTLDLCDVHSVIGYYLRRRDEVEKYLSERKDAAAALKSDLERRFPYNGSRERLLAQRGYLADARGKESAAPTKRALHKAQELLEASDRAFDCGDTRNGSRLLWEAAIVGIADVAETRGWPNATLDDIKSAVRRLDDMDDREAHRLRRFRLSFSTAVSFRERAEVGDGGYELEEFEWSKIETRLGRNSIKTFIETLSELVERGDTFT